MTEEREIRERLRALVESKGGKGAADHLGMDVRTVLSLAAGARVRRGTVLLARQALSDADEASRAGE